MNNWLHGNFMPSPANDHKPHFLRSETTQLLIGILLISQLFFFIFAIFIAPNSKQIAAIITSTLVSQTNNERSNLKLSSLVTSEKLTQSAQLKARDMADKGYFAHKTPEGQDPWYFFNKVDYGYQYAGENLAVNFIDSKDVTNAWMNSKSHRDNILNDKFTEVGIATAQGKYKGKDAIFVVQHFGKPLKVVGLIPEAKTIETGRVIEKNDNQRNVLGASTEQNVSFLAKLLSKTSSFTISLELAIGLISLIALLLSLFVKIRVQHTVVLANGIMLVSIAVALIIINSILIQGTI